MHIQLSSLAEKRTGWKTIWTFHLPDVGVSFSCFTVCKTIKYKYSKIRRDEIPQHLSKDYCPVWQTFVPFHFVIYETIIYPTIQVLKPSYPFTKKSTLISRYESGPKFYISVNQNQEPEYIVSTLFWWEVIAPLTPSSLIGTSIAKHIGLLYSTYFLTRVFTICRWSSTPYPVRKYSCSGVTIEFICPCSSALWESIRKRAWCF